MQLFFQTFTLESFQNLVSTQVMPSILRTLSFTIQQTCQGAFQRIDFIFSWYFWIWGRLVMFFWFHRQLIFLTLRQVAKWFFSSSHLTQHYRKQISSKFELLFALLHIEFLQVFRDTFISDQELCCFRTLMPC
jgi:hypothetical protein